MAIDILESKVVGTNKETWYKLIGTSEDTKPIGEFPAGTGHTVAKDSTFFEIGTQIKYEFDGSAWAPKGQVDIKLIEKTITENGTYNPADDDVDGYSSVTVNCPEPGEYNCELGFTNDVDKLIGDTRGGIRKIILPDDTVRLGTNFLYSNKFITSITIPTQLIGISESTFSSCSNLSEVIFKADSKCQDIGKEAFKNCTSLTQITIPASMGTIHYAAFSGCTNLQTITINKPEDSISGAPWGASNAEVIWTG